jgi:adenylate cyclase
MRVLDKGRPSGSRLPRRAMAERPADKNPRVCRSCFSFIAKHGGAEIEASFMFADIRRSTTLAENMSAGQFHSRLDRFYATASAVVFEQDGAVDKFVAQRSRD